MKQIFITTVLLTVLWSCNNTTKRENSSIDEDKVENNNPNFGEYVSTLDQTPLPLKHNPMGQLPELSKNYDKSGFEKYKLSWTYQPLGIYYKDEKTIGILEYSIGDWGLVLFLITYDLKGNKIDSTGFYDKSGQDMGYYSIEHLTFNENRTVIVLDTVKRWDLNEDESDIVEGTLKMTTGKVEYRILENGQIEKVNWSKSNVDHIKNIRYVFEDYIQYQESTDSQDDKDLMTKSLKSLTTVIDKDDLDLLINVWMYYDPTDYPDIPEIYRILKDSRPHSIEAVKNRIDNKKEWETDYTASYSDLKYLLKRLENE